MKTGNGNDLLIIVNASLTIFPFSPTAAVGQRPISHSIANNAAGLGPSMAKSGEGPASVENHMDVAVISREACAEATIC